MNWTDQLGVPVTRLPADTPKVHQIEGWAAMSHPERLAVIQNIAETEGRKPELATFAVKILREYGVEARDFRGQAAAFLDWIQKNIHYVNEPDERLQAPSYTLRPEIMYGDCDDMIILFNALCTSVRLPTKPVIVGKKRGKYVRYILGDPKGVPSGVAWTHVYGIVNVNPYGDKWLFAEPTLKGVPLGWDIVSAGGRLPELGDVDVKVEETAQGGSSSPSAPPLPHLDPNQWLGVNWNYLVAAVLLGTVTSAITALVVDSVQERRRSLRKHPVDAHVLGMTWED